MNMNIRKVSNGFIVTERPVNAYNIVPRVHVFYDPEELAEFIGDTAQIALVADQSKGAEECPEN